MTMDDLKGLRELHRERQRIIDRMDQLRASVQRTSPNLDGMPHGGQQRDIMAEYAANFEDAIRTLGTIEQRLTERFLRGIENLPLRIAGPSDAREQVGVVSLDFGDLDNGELAYALERDYGILTRVGLHCAPNAHKTLGTFPQGTVRFSFGYATKEEEIDYAVNAIRKMALK